MFPTFSLPFLFTTTAMVFSWCLVDFNYSNTARRLHFNILDLIWMLVVALAISWPAWVIYLIPYWQAAAFLTAFSLLAAWQLTHPPAEVARLELFRVIPKAAFYLLAFFTIFSTWITFLYFWFERACGDTYVGAVNLAL